MMSAYIRNETENTIESRVAVTLSGDSLWRKNSENEIVNIDSIQIREYDIDEYHFVDVYVSHDSDWTIYTDSGFERRISEAIGFDVHWSEQGMQKNGVAHLEVA